MSTFYDELSRYYDTIFPAEPDITGFLAENLNTGRRVLDLACGTGAYSLELANLGFEVTGIDLDRAMIEKAKSKNNGSVSFLAADMIDGLENVGTLFDGIFCIGNSLPHLDSVDDVARALKAWQEILTHDGVLYLQLVNFSRFAVGAPKELPVIEIDGLHFQRRYLPGPAGKVVFAATLKVPGNEEVFNNSVDLLALDRDTLDSLLSDSGLKAVEHYGSYSGEKYDPETSFLLICGAKKK
ncbi:MAG: class I SAM-dependent methyltransferase [Spirochaetales bacterium]|jgi:glycine/sarcosine N-methyltransferase|nr:class I SAM-dependent methyltransferase [Spirochaetales bacterium]